MKMQDESVFTEVQNVCRVVFNRSDLIITEETNAGDIAEWDSVTNLFLIDQLERKFSIKFSLMDIMNAQNVGDLVKAIMQKM